MAGIWINLLMLAACLQHIAILNTRSFAKAASLDEVDDQSLIISTDDDAKVVLHPPKNITFLLVGPKEVVITWLPPSVYTPHDVDTSRIDELLSANDSSSVPPQPAPTPTKAAEQVEQATTKEEAHVNETAVGAVDRDGGNVMDPVCHPLLYFFNYTIDVYNKSGEVFREPKWITMGDIYKKENITAEPGDKIVSFSQGCVREYLIVYSQKSQNKSDDLQVIKVNASDEPEVYLKNLRPATDYQVYVAAVFVSNDTLNSTVFDFTTKQEMAPKKICCDYHGTLLKEKLACDENGTQTCECRIGYTGQFCEMCAPGFYRTAPYFPCHRCPCSQHAARDQTCRFREGFLTCSECEKGYTGNICHMCAYGFYRYKQYCVPCNCHGNADPQSPYMCDVITGACTKCINNTSGMNCEQCKKGYIGDALTYKNCTLKVENLSTVFDFESIPEGVIAAICVGVILLLSVIVGCIVYVRWNKNPQNRPFWTVELKDDHEGVNFNTVPNSCDDEVRVVGAKVTMDDMEFYEKQGGSGHSRTGGYARLQENV